LSSLEQEQAAADLAKKQREEAADKTGDIYETNARANELGERADINQGMDAAAAAARREQEFQAKLEAANAALDRQASTMVEGVSNLAGNLVNSQSAVNAALQSANQQLQGISAEVGATQSGMTSLSNSERRSRRLTQRFYY
jgi:hypothetical protein